MIINFNNIDEKFMPQFKGGEKEACLRIYNDNNNKIMKGRLAPGASIGLHTHETNSEIIYILDGTATLIYDNTTETLTPGDCHYCPQGHSHSLMNKSNGELIFFAVVPEHKSAPSV